MTPHPGVGLLYLTRGQALCRQIIVAFVEFSPLGIRLVLDKVRNIEDVVEAIPAGQHARHLKLLVPGLAALASLIKLGFTRNFDGKFIAVSVKYTVRSSPLCLAVIVPSSPGKLGLVTDIPSPGLSGGRGRAGTSDC